MAILLIDDDVELCELLLAFLQREGFVAEAMHRFERDAWDAVRDRIELVVLDVGLPGLNGLDVLRILREGSRVPVLMLTARGDDIDRILGLELGADDYLPKPFNPRELAARIRAILRRYEPRPAAAGNRLEVNGIQLDPAAR
ncbi:MAG: response regulator, partial [Lysobacteraceae bacterium]